MATMFKELYEKEIFNIKIRKAENGFIVEIDCNEYIFKNIKQVNKFIKKVWKLK